MKLQKYSNLNPVRDNKLLFTIREVERVNNARTLYQHCNKPTYVKFLKLLDKRYFIDCPVTSEDMKRVSFIYGPENKRCKATRQRLDSLAMIPNIALPANIIEQHRNIMLSVDYVYIQGIPMFHTISGRSCQFRTLEPITIKVKTYKEDILNGLRKVINIYRSRGINITQINGDNEFDSIKNDHPEFNLNILASNDHVGDIERANRTLKERTRTLLNDLPYSQYPKSMVVGCTVYTTKILNDLSCENGLSNTLSPATLITGTPPPSYKEITKLKFRDNVEIPYEETRNDNITRTMEGIALYPFDNSSGGWHSMSSITGYPSP